MLPILVALDRQPRFITFAATAAAVFVLGAADYATGWEISFSVFYLLPVAAAAWVLGPRAGLLVGALAAVVWLMANMLAGEEFSSPAVSYWNTGVRFGFFAALTMTVSALRRSVTALEAALTRERALSRVDSLTGVANSRAFRERMEIEAARAARTRSPITIAYLDVDHFKRVNDERGHAAGDALLVTIAETLAGRMRQTDLVARMGGDEFALLLPDTGRAAAEHVLEDVRDRLARRLADGGAGITVSIGATVLEDARATVDALIHEADSLMYRAKKEGRDRLEIRLLASPARAAPR